MQPQAREHNKVCRESPETRNRQIRIPPTTSGASQALPTPWLLACKTVSEQISVVLSHQIYYDLLQHP